MQRNQSIDTVRMIASICIIAIHSQMFKDTNIFIYNLTVRGLFRFAVPLFFVISGYFYYDRLQKHRETKSYYKYLIKIFIIFETIELIIYTPFQLNTFISNPIAYIWRACSAGIGGAYWYLFSLIVTLLLVTPLWKNKKILWGILLGILLNMFSMTNDTYSFLFTGTAIQSIAEIYQNVFTWPQAGLCMSLLYLSIGAYIKEHEVNIKVNKMILLLSFGLLLAESFFCQSHEAIDGNSYFSLYLLVPLLFIYLLEHPVSKIYKRYFAKMALYMYMVHPIINNSVGFLFRCTYELKFIVVVVITAVIAYMIVIKKGYTKKEV